VATAGDDRKTEKSFGPVTANWILRQLRYEVEKLTNMLWKIPYILQYVMLTARLGCTRHWVWPAHPNELID
jgi:hypothetical protein